MLLCHMRIPISRIKHWNAKERLEELEKRIDDVGEEVYFSEDAADKLGEIKQILKYWKKHLEKPGKNAPEENKLKKSDKPSNLWNKEWN